MHIQLGRWWLKVSMLRGRGRPSYSRGSVSQPRVIHREGVKATFIHVIKDYRVLNTGWTVTPVCLSESPLMSLYLYGVFFINSISSKRLGQSILAFLWGSLSKLKASSTEQAMNWCLFISLQFIRKFVLYCWRTSAAIEYFCTHNWMLTTIRNKSWNWFANQVRQFSLPLIISGNDHLLVPRSILSRNCATSVWALLCTGHCIDCTCISLRVATQA